MIYTRAPAQIMLKTIICFILHQLHIPSLVPHSVNLHWFFNLPASKACSNHIPSSISRGSSIVATSGGLQSTAKWRTI